MATQLSLLLLGLLATASAIPIEPKAGDDNGVLHDRGSVIGGLRPLPKKEGHGDLVGDNHPPPVGGLLGGQREPPVHHDSNGFELPPPGGEGHLVGGQRPGRLAPGQIVGTGVIVGSHRIPLHGVGSDEELEGGLRPPHDINNEPLIGGEHPHPRKIAGGERPPPIGQGSEEELENGLRPPHDIEHEPLIGGEHPHPRKIAGGERPPPVHGGDSNEELQNGLRPPHDIDDEPLVGGEHPHPRKIAGGERPPIHPEDDEEEVAGGYRPPHDINNKPLVGGEHPHHDGLEGGERPVPEDSEEVGVKPWTPRPKTSARPPFRVTPGQAYNGLPIPLGEKYWFLYDVPLESRNDFFRIINTPTYTKVETRKYVNKWAERQGAKKVKEVEAFEDEDDHYHSEVRVALDNIFEALPDVYGKIKDIQDNPHLTKEGEVQQELAVFSAQEDVVRDALIYILKRVDYKSEVQIPIPKE